MNTLSQNTSRNQHILAVQRVAVVGLLSNFILSVLKISAGWLGKSNAVFADGIHSLSDCVTDVIILVGVRFWTKPPDECHPYGHKRIETIITVFVGLILVAVAIGITVDAIISLRDKNGASPSILTLLVALASIVIKEILYRWTKKSGRKLNSSSLIANAWHHRSDALSSIPVALAVAANLYDPSLYYFDKIGAIIVSIFILWVAWKIVAPGLNQLADRAASQEDVEEIVRISKLTNGVQNVHAVRTRRSGAGVHVDMHILVSDSITVRQGHDISTVLQQELKLNGPEIADVVIHIEPNE